jgi:hypothetical protein
MSHVIRFFFVAAAASAFAACVTPTSFEGAPKVPNGATGCRAQGMELAGMVFMGEYSDGCICTLPGQNQPAVVSGAGAQAAAVGVRLQMTAAEEAARRNQKDHQPSRPVGSPGQY